MPPAEPTASAEPPPRTPPRCPSCGSRRGKVISLFGTQAMTLQYRCQACGDHYEAIKYEDSAGID